MPQLDTNDVPHAPYLAVGMCTDPKCSKVHLIMFDENEKPVAFTGITDVPKLIEDLHRWAYIAATRRDP